MYRVGLAALGLLVAGTSAGLSQSHDTKMTCTNPASGTNWQISIDFARNTVDSFAADISSDEISWHDQRDSGNYTLDRHSGDLSVAYASSTGGYIMHDRCAAKTGR